MNISTLDDEDYYKVYSVLTKAIKLAKKDKNELLYYQLISYFIINYSIKVFNLGTLLQKLKIVNYIVILKKNKYIK
jgi:ribosomal protein L30E